MSDLGNQQLKREIGFKSKEEINFPNPYDQLRKVHVFCDAPHLIKLLRNHILDSGIQLPDGEILDKNLYLQVGGTQI